jgi:hypothetical protein
VGGGNPHISKPPFFFLLVPGHMDQPKKNKNRYLKFSVHDHKLATEKVVYYCQRLVISSFIGSWGFLFIYLFILGFGNLSTIHLTS